MQVNRGEEALGPIGLARRCKLALTDFRVIGVLIGFALPITEAVSETFPNVTGTYTGSGYITEWGCQDPAYNGTFGPFNVSFDLGPQEGSSFTGSGLFTASIEGTYFSQQITLTSGTVSPSGTLSGAFNYVLLANGAFDSSGYGTFSGSLVENTITVNSEFRDTVGDTCVGTSSGTGTRPPPTVFPDLVVSSVAVTDTTLTPGQSFRIDAVVQNQGDGASSSSTLRYYRSFDPTISVSDSQIGTVPVAAFVAGASGAYSLTVLAPSVPGTYYIGACVDAVSGESNTANNCSSGVEIVVTNPASILIPILSPILLDDDG